MARGRNFAAFRWANVFLAWITSAGSNVGGLTVSGLSFVLESANDTCFRGDLKTESRGDLETGSRAVCSQSVP